MKSKRGKYQYDVSEFNNYQDFIDFLDKYPEVKEFSIRHFNQMFPVINAKYDLLVELGVIDPITQPLTDLLGEETRNYTYGNTIYKTLLDFDTFIIQNNVIDKSDLRNRFPAMFYRAQRLGYINKLHFPGKLTYNDFDNMQVIQEFVDEFNIQTRAELRRDYITIYRRYSKIKKSVGGELVFKSGIFESSHEKRLFDWVNENSDIQLVPQVYIENYRYDFVVYGTKLIIEVHGPQHFDPVRAKEAYGIENQIEKDLNKYQVAVNNGYNIIYFSYVKESIINNSNYFSSVLRNETDLLEIIQKENYIPRSTKKINNDSNRRYNFYNYEKEPVEKSEKTISWELESLSNFNKFLQQEKISSPAILKKNFKYHHGYAERKLWIPYLIYYTEPGSIGVSKNYKSIEDIQKVIDERKIKSQADLMRVSSSLVSVARKNKWLDKLKYYKGQ